MGGEPFRLASVHVINIEVAETSVGIENLDLIEDEAIFVDPSCSQWGHGLENRAATDVFEALFWAGANF